MLFRYRPALGVDFIQSVLGYGDTNESRDDVIQFLSAQGAKLLADNSKVDCKQGLNPPTSMQS